MLTKMRSSSKTVWLFRLKMLRCRSDRDSDGPRSSARTSNQQSSPHSSGPEWRPVHTHTSIEVCLDLDSNIRNVPTDAHRDVESRQLGARPARRIFRKRIKTKPTSPAATALLYTAEPTITVHLASRRRTVTSVSADISY